MDYHQRLSLLLLMVILTYHHFDVQCQELDGDDNRQKLDINENLMDESEIESVTVEDYVHVLDNSSYHWFVSNHLVTMVQFYAPWCAHCKSLEPEYSKAAKMLQNDKQPIYLAKIDATKFPELAKGLDVNGFPTIFIYQNGTRSDYDGSRKAEAIADYMREIGDPNYRPPPESVITLTESNFDTTINREPLILVEFYAPWCGHCKQLKPQYERASKQLLQLPKPIPLAKVDATVEKSLAKRFEVSAYPTFRLFRNGKQYPYKGPRKGAGVDDNGIVDYMKLMQLPPSQLVQTKVELRKQLREDIPTVVGLFRNDSEWDVDDELLTRFIDLAYDQIDENNRFVHITDQRLIEELKEKPDTVLLYIPLWYRSKYEPNAHRLSMDKSTTTTEQIIQFIQTRSVPLVGYRNPKTMSLYGNRYPLVVVYYDVDFSFDHRKQTQLIREQVLKAAAKLAQKSDDVHNLTFVIANESDNEQELKELRLDDSGEDVNVAYFVSNRRRYSLLPPSEDFDSDVLLEFIEDVQFNRRKPIIKSQLIPEHNPIDNLWTVVGEQFEELVTKSDRDSLIEFYAPWCGHCKSLEPIYRGLATKLSLFLDDRIRVMKIDATVNDYPEQFEVKGFPTIFYVRSRDPTKPILFGGDRTEQGLEQFVRENLDNNKDEL